MSDKATPRPWRVDTTIETPSIICDLLQLVDDDEGNVICFAPEGLGDSMRHWPANAKLIVQAVNSHNALVEAAQLSLKLIEKIPLSPELSMQRAGLPEKLRTALKLAEG